MPRGQDAGEGAGAGGSTLLWQGPVPAVTSGAGGWLGHPSGALGEEKETEIGAQRFCRGRGTTRTWGQHQPEADSAHKTKVNTGGTGWKEKGKESPMEEAAARGKGRGSPQGPSVTAVSPTSPGPRRGGQPPWAPPSTPSGSPSSSPPELVRRLGLGSCRLRTRRLWKGNRVSATSRRDTGTAPVPRGQSNEQGGAAASPSRGSFPGQWAWITPAPIPARC